MIPVDSIYTPVERVNMNVENTRVGQITDFDKLTLDVFTNGTLGPDEAVSLAAKVLSEHLNLFIDLSENAKTAEVMVEKEDNEKEDMMKVRNLGRKSLEEVLAKLKELGLQLNPSDE